MNRDTRIESYRKIYAHLKEVKGLTNFEYSDEQKNLEFQFDGGPFHFHYCLFVNSDRVQIRAVMKTDMDEEKASSIAKEISSNMEGMSGTSYDNQIILQSNVIFFGISDQEAAKLIYDKTCEFVKYVMEYVEKEFPDIIDEKEIVGVTGSADSIIDENANTTDKSEFVKEPKENHLSGVSEVKTGNRPDQNDETNTIASEDSGNKSSASNNKWADDIFSQISQSLSNPAANEESGKTEQGITPIDSEDVENVKMEEDGEEIDTSDLKGKADLGAALEAPLNAPEEIKAMYEEMNFTFAMRKDQLDYSDQLVKKQKAYIKAEKEQILKERQELDAKKKDVEEQEGKLRSKWNNYNSAKKNQMERESALAEREAKARVISEKMNEKQTTLDGLIESNRMQKDELERLRIKTHEQKEMLDDEKATLQKDKEELENQRKRLQERTDELTAKEQKLRLIEGQMAMREKAINEKMNDLKEMEDLARNMQLPGYNPDPSVLKSHSEEKKEKEKLFQKIKELETKLKNEQTKNQMASGETNATIEEIKKARDILKNDYSSLKEMNQTMEKEIEDLKRQLSNRTEERDKNAASLVTLEKDAAALKERAERAENQNETLQNEISELREKISDDTILIDKARKRIDILKNESSQCIDDLEASGYHMEEVQGEGDQLFRGAKDDTTFYVNRKIRVLYVEKPAKSKNQRTLSEWNGEDMRFSYSYSISEKKATCRCVYTNIVEDLGAVLTKFDELK